MTSNFQKNSEVQNNFILNNPDNYKKKLDYLWKEIIDKYLEVIMEYIKYIFENIKIKKINLSKYIIIRGLDTLTHVFRFLLYYTKNLSMTFYNTQRALYYYVEFIDQISEEEVSYLKLTSNDAILYVYKKTIYQINEKHRNTMNNLKENDQKLFDLLNEYIYMFKTIIIEFIYENDWNPPNHLQINKNIEIIYKNSKNINKNDLKNHIKWLKEEKWKVKDEPILVP